jgi:hypothetical protein
MVEAESVGIIQHFKLTVPISLSNMMALDAQGIIKKFNSPEDILSDFCAARLQFLIQSKPKRVWALLTEIHEIKTKLKHFSEVPSGHAFFQPQIDHIRMLASLKARQLITLRSTTVHDIWSLALDNFVTKYNDLFGSTLSSTSLSLLSSSSTQAAAIKPFEPGVAAPERPVQGQGN